MDRTIERAGRRRRSGWLAAAGFALAVALYPASSGSASAQVVTARQAPPGAVVAVPALGLGDERRFMHGIGWASAGGDKSWVFFSSSGLPPRGANRDGSWPHDVYVGAWSPGHPRLAGVHIFISRPEAQEPVSVAQNTQGNIFVSFEDGWNTPNEVSQRYGVYRSNLAPIKPYPNDVESGGHSGHVAAVGERFVVFYSEDWVDGGGVDNLGTGNGVYVKVYDGSGKLLRHENVAVHVREWWPMIAGSSTKALLVWQKYIPGEIVAQLEFAVYDPVSGKLERPEDGVNVFRVQYYTYAAAWVPAANRFVLEATLDNGRTSILLIDEAGHVTAKLECLPASVRESSIAVDGNVAYVPTRDGRLMALALTGSTIDLHGMMRAPFAWGNTGAIGIPYGPGTVHFVSLSPVGLREANFNVHNEVAPSASDRCGPERAAKQSDVSTND
ncbi:PQQ-binding-like beta-propeller repeat protein [Paraburkholderia oxyphila]|uniref:PQQ-binding-like beta-propeller repeat protein n=1 Tax=Paraburkholderia oxyphila TaxID=614212 RepID=UPI0012EDE1F1|nr:PQQ-binding-like beta-propeller repeat protein [Paraburkholderia oxyphila]